MSDFVERAARTDAYKQGQRAWRDGKRRDYRLIPYTPGTNGWHDWLAGYDDAKATSLRAEAEHE